MELCLIRHAIAVEPDPGAFADDGLRPLTHEGRERMERAASGLTRLFQPEGIISSPLVRARQTAEILQRAWSIPKLRYSEHLATGDHDALMKEAAAFGWQRAAVVGHEPHLSHLVSLLLSGGRTRVAFDFKRGAAAVVSFPDYETALAGSGTLLAFLPPGALRAMRRRNHAGDATSS